MDLNAYLLDGVVEATAPPNETEAAARSRTDAIVEMVCAYDPRDGMEAMIACHCVMLQFLLNAAMRDASNTNLEPAVLTRARSGAMSISRTLHQWVTKYEKLQKRNEARAAAAREAAQTQAVSVPAAAPEAVEPPVTPPRPPISLAADRRPIHAPATNGRAAIAPTHPGNALTAAASGSPSKAAGQAPTVHAGDRRMTL